MSAELISECQPKARKTYRCEACEVILEGGLKHFLQCCTFSEKKALAKARKDNWKIQVGEIYLDQVCSYEGRIYHFRAKLEIDSLVRKYDFYPEY